MAPNPRSSHPGGAPRSWVHEYFYDHPGRTSKLPASFASASYYKAICKLCFEAEVLKITQLEIQSPHPRSRMQIEEHIWAQDTDALWIQSRPITLANHLKQCTLQDASIRERARAFNTRSPRNPRRWPADYDFGPVQMQPAFVPPSGLALMPPNTPISFPSTNQFPLARSSSAPSLLLHENNAQSPPTVQSVPELPTSHLMSSSAASSPLSSLGSPNVMSFPTASYSKKRRRNISQSVDPPQMIPFSQARFDSLIARLTASAGLPLWWIENPQWLTFVATFIPQAVSPSRYVLTNRLLPTEHGIYVAKAKQAVTNHSVTLQCDGWNGLNTHHYIAFRITTAAERQCFTIKVYDASSEPKTAEMLLAHIVEVINLLEDDWKVQVIALTTDASGESRRARKDLQIRRPHMVVPDCFAHQVNLIVGDYFKADTEFIATSESASELITWLRSKTFLLGLLREVQVRQGHTPLSVLRAVLTRWTAHYIAYERLINLRAPLMLLIDDDEKQVREKNLPSLIIKGDAAAKAKARRMISSIKSGFFWHNLLRIKRHLEPLAIAANITQATHTRLDDVLITLGFLLLEFTNLSDPEDEQVKAVVLASLESRWKKADQDVFIAAVVLNPLLKLSPFKESQWNTRTGLYGLLAHLYSRFFPGEQVPQSLDSELRDYLAVTGAYRDLDNYVKQRMSQSSYSLHNEAWDSWDSHVHNSNTHPLARLAKHIFSICPNSASCERLFSVYGNTLSKLRTRLKSSTLSHLTELKMFLKDEEDREDNVGKRLKRNFGNYPSQTTTANEPVNPPIQSLPAGPSSSLITGPAVISLNSPSPSYQHIPPSDPSAANPSELPDTSDIRISGSETVASFTTIVNELAQLCEGDSIPEEIRFTPHPRSLSDLFDFGRVYWMERMREKARKGLDEELELCELLDIDAEGETVDGEEVLTF